MWARGLTGWLGMLPTSIAWFSIPSTSPMPYFMPMSRHRSQPSTAGASIRMICWTSGSPHASSQASVPSFIASIGSSSPDVATTSAM